MRLVVTGATVTVGTGVLAALDRDAAATDVVAVARRLPPGGHGGPKVRRVAADVARDDLAVAGAAALVDLPGR